MQLLERTVTLLLEPMVMRSPELTAMLLLAQTVTLLLAQTVTLLLEPMVMRSPELMATLLLAQTVMRLLERMATHLSQSAPLTRSTPGLHRYLVSPCFQDQTHCQASVSE